MRLRTAHAISVFKTKYRISKILRISRQAVTAWGEWVPEGRIYQLLTDLGENAPAGTVEATEQERERLRRFVSQRSATPRKPVKRGASIPV
jgi:hypothetical protein